MEWMTVKKPESGRLSGLAWATGGRGSAGQSPLYCLAKSHFVVVAQVALGDAALLVDEKRRGRELDVAERFGDFAGSVQSDGEGQLPGPGEIANVFGRVVVHGHGDDFIALGGVLLIGLDGVGHLLHAGDAAGGPELDQHYLAA